MHRQLHGGMITITQKLQKNKNNNKINVVYLRSSGSSLPPPPPPSSSLVTSCSSICIFSIVYPARTLLSMLSLIGHFRARFRRDQRHITCGCAALVHKGTRDCDKSRLRIQQQHIYAATARAFNRRAMRPTANCENNARRAARRR